MKSILNYAAVFLLSGIIFFISCKKKDVSCEGCADKNKPPIANAGSDQITTLPKDSVSLDGSASTDPDGKIVSWRWTKISGPVSSNIIKADSSKTLIKALVMGVYKFELAVTDNEGLSAKDTVQIIVDDPVVNQPPIANAGADQIITLPIDSTLLNGALSFDPDGTIVGYQWTKISGPVSSIIINPLAVQTRAKNLSQGVYQFELRVTDNGGLSAKDTVQIIVNSAGPTNYPPVANAGPDQVITLPNNSVALDGSGSTDPDNNITGYLWTKIFGPSSFTIVNPNAVQTPVTNLVQGTYRFELKVADAGGLFDTDTIEITVNPASSTSHWTILSSPPSFGTETFLLGIDVNNVFIGDGYNHKFYKYNYQTNTWTPKANVPGQAYDYLVSFGVNGKGYTGMGYDLNTQHNEMYQYDPVSNQWIQKNNSPLSGSAVPMVINNLVYLVKTPLVWMYNPVSDSYTQKNNFPGNLLPNSSNSSFVINGTGYFISGTECREYNTSTDTWLQKASLPGYLKVQAGFSSNNYGYVLGDSSQSAYNLNYPLHLWRYDPLQNNWLRIYDDYPGSGAYLIKTLSLIGYAYVGFGYNNGDFSVGDFRKFQ
jgi:hypothetical protein